MNQTLSGHIHCHTPASDGDITPEAILNSGVKLRFIAATDHDSLEGYEILAPLEAYGVKVIPGVELTVLHQNIKFHLLILYPEKTEFLQQKLSDIQQQRRGRIKNILKLLEDDDWIVPEDFNTPRKLPTKRDIFKAVFEANPELVDSFKLQHYQRLKNWFIGRYDIGTVGLNAGTVLPRIKGIKILAHPAYSAPTPDQWKKVAGFLQEFQIRAIETVTRKHSPEQIIKTEQLAADQNLLAMTSNDVHKLEHLFKNQTPCQQLEKLLSLGG